MKNMIIFQREKTLRYATTVCLFITALTLTSCFQNFYTVKSNNGFENLDTLTQKGDKQIIVHYADTIVALSSPEIDAEKITGKINKRINNRRNVNI